MVADMVVVMREGAVVGAAAEKAMAGMLGAGKVWAKVARMEATAVGRTAALTEMCWAALVGARGAMTAGTLVAASLEAAVGSVTTAAEREALRAEALAAPPVARLAAVARPQSER